MDQEKFLVSVREVLGSMNYYAGQGYTTEAAYLNNMARLRAELDRLVLERAKTLLFE